MDKVKLEACPPTGAQSSIEFRQQRGRALDLIDWAINEYREFMLDDDYNAQGTLDRIITRLRDARPELYDPRPTASEPSGEPFPGCYADLQRRRVTTLATLGLMLSKMAGGEAAEVVGFDAASLYADVLMALAIEDADDTDIALEIARDEPQGDVLATLTPPPSDAMREALREARQTIVIERDNLVDCCTIGGDRQTLEEGAQPDVERMDAAIASIDAALASTEGEG